MVLDSSVLVQLIFAEPGHREMLERILEAEVRVVGAPTLVEVGMVLTSRLGPDNDELLMRLEAQVVPFETSHS